MKRIKHINGIESSEGREGVQGGKQNGRVIFKPIIKRSQPCADLEECSQQGPRKCKDSEMGTRLFGWRNGMFCSTNERAVKEARKDGRYQRGQGIYSVMSSVNISAVT